MAELRDATYTDESGRHWLVKLPLDAPDTEARRGIPVGPPSLSGLELPLDTEIRLHNELFARRMFTLDDCQRRRVDVVGALMAALRVDAESIVTLYTTAK